MPAAIPQLAIRDAAVTFGGKPLFSGIDATLGRGERVCLVGANGSGKSTILKALAGEIELDRGTRFVQPGTRIGYLPQNVDLNGGGSVAEFVAGGGTGLHADDYRVATLLDHVQLDGARALASLSGGEGRRAALARTLAAEPDLLLLDEPTNHLDLPTIQWLEQELADFPGGILMISHDRAFLRRLTQRLLWLDRGRMFERDGGFDGFEEWSQNIAEQEAAEYRRLEKRLEQEEYWLRRGVTARRSRNEGRRRKLFALRQQKAESLKTRGRAKLQVTEAELGGRLAIEAIDISKHFTRPDGSQVAIVENFSTRIMRGDRVGILGPNGAGKTTLIKLLTGAERPDSGEVRLGLGIAPIYLDQRRESFDLDKTLWETLAPGGGDSILVNGQQRHIVGYLRDFLFDERQATMPVRLLSGGERARLMLAKLFAQPSNLIVLDEPTNDLDMDTLDLLQDVLSEYDGTLLLVSHDRDFLDRLVTSTIAVEGDGDVQEYAGGYSDYVIQRGEREAARPAAKKAAPKPAEPARPAASAPARFSMKEQRELADITSRLDRLHAEIATLEGALADPALYQRDPAKAAQAGALLARKRDELHAAEERWLELEEKRATMA
ncbi:MAG TPA: ATP-binding cassette domain-containing protein [Alphaproteobacteria bacterium]|nr:ATP-binding cassette domain-containing protein [Alphaproteobacteria bacterium]